MTSQAGTKTIRTNMWSDISKSKDTQMMKFGEVKLGSH